MFSAALPHCFQRRSPSLQIRLCSLSHFCPPENVLFPLVFALAPVRLGRVSSFFLLSPLLSSTPSQALPIFGCSSFNQFFFFLSSHCLDWKCLSPRHSGRFFLFFFGSYIKVLSVASWNYLGAKLIALDPTSLCNRLSANLGFSRCSQVGPGGGCTSPSAPLKVLTFATHCSALHCHTPILFSQSLWCWWGLYSLLSASVPSILSVIHLLKFVPLQINLRVFLFPFIHFLLPKYHCLFPSRALWVFCRCFVFLIHAAVLSPSMRCHWPSASMAFCFLLCATIRSQLGETNDMYQNYCI